MTSSTSARGQRRRLPCAPWPNGHDAAAPDWANLRSAPGIEFLPPSGKDREFAQQLYMETMRPLLQRLDAWDEREMVAHFRAGFVPEQMRLIHFNGVPIGYLQVAEADDALTLLQIHLLAGARGRGIGTAIIRALLDYAERGGKEVLLSVVRHNPAIALYRRLGFAVVTEDPVRLHMRRWPPPARGDGRPIGPEPTASRTRRRRSAR